MCDHRPVCRLVWLLLILAVLLITLPRGVVVVEPDELLGYWLDGDGSVTRFVRRDGRIIFVVE